MLIIASKMIWSATILAMGLFLGVASIPFCPLYEEGEHQTFKRSTKTPPLYEEGKNQTFMCSTKTPKFSRYGLQLRINGVYNETSYCDSDGHCTDTDPTRYQAQWEHDELTGYRTVFLTVSKMDRTMTLATCFLDGKPDPSMECIPAFYRAPTLESYDNVTFDPVTQDFRVNFYIISNPPTYNFSLSVRFNETSASSPLSSQYYSANYTGNRGGDYMKGTIQLIVETSDFRNDQRTGFFTFTASNGIVKSSPIEFPFTIIRYNIPPTQALCESPIIVDSGATAVIRCTADRLYPTGQCDFQLSTILKEPATMITTNSDSTVYPGDKQVTCELRVPLVGNSAGQYQFQVKITPSKNPVNLSTSVRTPPIELGAPTLESYDNVTFDPVTQDFRVNFYIISNPPTNDFSLSVRFNETSASSPLSSQYYFATYTGNRGGDYMKGTIQLIVETSGFRNDQRTGFFTFTASNGIVKSSPIEVPFTIIRYNIPPTQALCKFPIIVDSGATAVIRCTADRLYPTGQCDYELSTILKEQATMSTTNSDSTVYPGDKQVTCELRVPLVGNSAGQYLFQVKITPSKNPVNLSTSVITPPIELATTTPEEETNWHILLRCTAVSGGISLIIIVIAMIILAVMIRNSGWFKLQVFDHLRLAKCCQAVDEST